MIKGFLSKEVNLTISLTFPDEVTGSCSLLGKESCKKK